MVVVVVMPVTQCKCQRSTRVLMIPGWEPCRMRTCTSHSHANAMHIHTELAAPLHACAPCLQAVAGANAVFERYLETLEDDVARWGSGGSGALALGSCMWQAMACALHAACGPLPTTQARMTV